MWIVRFEMVSAIDHPEYYENEAPLCTVDEVLAEDWKAVAVTHYKHPQAVGQFRGLKELCRRGELIRNVKLRPVIDLDPAGFSEQPVEQYQLLQDEVVDAQIHSGGQDQHHQPDQGRSGSPERRPDGH
jgi:hypothetical protein